jgi:hypothetical protein
MVYENVSKPIFKRAKQAAKRRFSQPSYKSNNGNKQTFSNWDVLDMPEPLESWSLEDFNDVVHLD